MRWLVSATLAALMLYGPSSAMQRTPSATVGDIPALIDAGRYEDAEAKAALARVQPELSRGVARGVLHKNTASRKLSRLTRRLVALG